MSRLNFKDIQLGFWMALLLNAISQVACEDLFINPWQLRAPNQPYESLTAAVGDSITFFWSGDENHSVYINPSGTCSDFDSILIGNSPPVTYTFDESDAVASAAGNPIFFADNIDQLCEWGMRFTVSVVGPVTADPPGDAPVDEDPGVSSTTPTDAPIVAATAAPTSSPTGTPTASPSSAPVVAPTPPPTSVPSGAPSGSPVTPSPTSAPTSAPTGAPSLVPSDSPTIKKTGSPSQSPSAAPTTTGSASPTATISAAPTTAQSNAPSKAPSAAPSSAPNMTPSAQPSATPSSSPSTRAPTAAPTMTPTTPPVDFPTHPPTFSPTKNPTANPTATPTSAPTPVPTAGPTVVPTPAPTSFPTMKATEPPVDVGGRVSDTYVGLRMGMAGLTEFTPGAEAEWQELTGQYTTSFVFNEMKDTVTNFVTTYEVTDSFPYTEGDGRRRMMRGESQESRNLQSQDIIIVEYTQTVKYNIVGSTALITSEDLITAPFETEAERAAYVTVLKTASDSTLAGVKGVSKVQVPTQPTQAPAPAPGGGLSRTAIIAISCGCGGLLIIIILFIIYCRGGGGDGDSKEDPPLHVDVRNDEVSTLAGPDGPPTYGDQSVATVDYDYSKAYGGAGDSSVSSAGGTFGSQTQNISLPANAGATGAALGSMDDDSYSAQYDSPRSNLTGNEEIIHIFAPPGKLGVVIDTPDDGAPVVHAVKDTSVIADRIIVGDKLVAVDDEDVRSMTAIKVSKMISRKGANPSRKLTIIRTVPISE